MLDFWRRRLRRLRFLATSLGLMMLVTVVVTVGILAAGVSMANTSDARRHDMGVLISTTEPTAFSAHRLYSSLSVADMSATTAFVGEDAADYDVALRHAVEAATDVAGGLDTQDPDDAKTMALVQEVQQQLPVYSAMVARAQALGDTAEMSDATALMRTTILPTAEALFVRTNRKVSDDQAALTHPQWVPISGLVVAVGMLLLAQVFLAWRTNRRLNKGFAAATVMMTTALLWVGVSNWMTFNAGVKGFEEASDPLKALTNARVYAQQARTDETLGLVVDKRTTVDTFTYDMQRISYALDVYARSDLAETPANAERLEAARAAVEQWKQAHPLKLSGTAAQGAAYQSVDDNVAELMRNARQELRSYFNVGFSASRVVSAVVFVLSLASVLALWLGIRPRLQEYL